MLLVFDATAGRCAVAAFDGGRCVGARSDAMTRGHAERLFPLIGECLKAAGLTYRDISAIAVCTGPGNFTGARIGVAAARGLALALGVPSIGVDRFDAAAEGVEGEICIRLEARGGAAHLAKYRDGAAIGAAETVQAVDIDAFIGDTPVLAVEEADLAAIARIAQRRLADGVTARPAPRYLKPANAAPPSDAPLKILRSGA